MTIDLAQPNDAAAIVQLVNAAYRGGGNRAGWTDETSLISGPRAGASDVLFLMRSAATHILVARSDEGQNLLGCVCVETADDACTISMLAVDPTQQSGGLGKAVLDSAEQFAIKHRCRTAKMTVIRQRTTLIAWYQRRGYHPTGEIEAFPYGDDRVGKPLRDDLDFVVLKKPLDVDR